MAPRTHPLCDHFRRQKPSAWRDAAYEAGVCGSCLTGGRNLVSWKAARWREDGLELVCGAGVVLKAHNTFVESWEKSRKLLEDAPLSIAKNGPNTTAQCCAACCFAQLEENAKAAAAEAAQVEPSPPQPIPMAREA
eukprot:gene27023-2250_t